VLRPRRKSEPHRLLSGIVLIAALLAPGVCVAPAFACTPLHGPLPQGVPPPQTARDTLQVLKAPAADAVREDTYRGEPVAAQPDIVTSRFGQRDRCQVADTAHARGALTAALRDRDCRTAALPVGFAQHRWGGTYARRIAWLDARAIAELRPRFRTNAYLRIGRELAVQLFGQQIFDRILGEIGALCEALLADVLDLLARLEYTLMLVDDTERDPAHAAGVHEPNRADGTLNGQPAEPDRRMVSSPTPEL
jgi:hypothetical protein